MPKFYFIGQIDRSKLRPMSAHRGPTGGIHLIRALEAPKNLPHFVNAYGVIKRGKDVDNVPIKKFRNQFNDIL